MCSTVSSGIGAASSTSPAEPVRAEHPSIPIVVTRRRLLATTAVVVICPMPALSIAQPIDAIDRGEPFDDGTFFDDGLGWVG